jgi:hypothetical protein
VNLEGKGLAEGQDLIRGQSFKFMDKIYRNSPLAGMGFLVPTDREQPCLLAEDSSPDTPREVRQLKANMKGLKGMYPATSVGILAPFFVQMQRINEQTRDLPQNSVWTRQLGHCLGFWTKAELQRTLCLSFPTGRSVI